MTSSNVECGPCGFENISKHANTWCTNCQEGFCKGCEKMHRATKMSRDHKLIGLEDYQRLSSISIIQMCEEHEKTLDSYCKTHDEALCFSCVLSQHKSCRDVIPLEDAARNAKISTALTDLEETITVGLNNVQSIIQKTSSANLDQQENKIKENIRWIRNRLNNRLDEIEKNIIFDLESKLAKYRSEHDEVIHHMKELGETLSRLQKETSDMKKLASDLHVFLGTRQINRKAYECIKSTSKYHTIDKYDVNFEINQDLVSLLTQVITFGKIKTEVTKEDIPLLQPKIHQAQAHGNPLTKSLCEIGVKVKQTFSIKKESKEMWVAGCTILPNGQLLISDYKGKEQLMEYNQNGTHVRDISVSSKPFDLTVIDEDRVAVSYGESKYIEILNIKEQKVEKKINLENKTWGLSYDEGKIVVVVGGRRIVVTDLLGEVVNTISINDGIVENVTARKGRIYYSNYKTNIVTCCDISGEQIWISQVNSAKCPFGLTVDNYQNVYITGVLSHNITIISRDGQTYQTLVTSSEGLFKPRAIDINESTGDLLVCNRGDTNAFLFKVTLK